MLLVVAEPLKPQPLLGTLPNDKREAQAAHGRGAAIMWLGQEA